MQVNVPVEVDAEMAAILQYARFSPDFTVQMTDNPDPSLGSAQQVNHTAELHICHLYVLLPWMDNVNTCINCLLLVFLYFFYILLEFIFFY